MKTKFRIGLILVSLIGLFTLSGIASAGGGVKQISSVGAVPEAGNCEDIAADVVLDLVEGDLEGCLYSFVTSSKCLPNGIYMERGTEIYIGSGKDGDNGTFETTYLFTSKWKDCNTFEVEIFGRCQHPIVRGTGTGDFEGVTGRLDIKDDVSTGLFYIRGHLKF